MEKLIRRQKLNTLGKREYIYIHTEDIKDNGFLNYPFLIIH